MTIMEDIISLIFAFIFAMAKLLNILLLSAKDYMLQGIANMYHSYSKLWILYISLVELLLYDGSSLVACLMLISNYRFINYL